MCENCNSKTWNGEWSGFSILKEKTSPIIEKRYGAILNPDGEYTAIDIDAKGVASWEKIGGNWTLKYTPS
jgi:RNA polymerase subunit RPABC4/transcription elongation factor Spt4